MLDLPLSASTRLMDVWLERIRQLADQVEWFGGDLDVRILAGTSNAMPTHRAGEFPWLRAALDPNDLRGTAGALRDHCRQFRDDDHVLVATASQCPDPGLLARFVSAADLSAGVSIAAGERRAPSGCMLIRCAALREIPEIGFIDLKEQALEEIAYTHGARVVTIREPVPRVIRGLESYIDAVRSWHLWGSLRGVTASRPFDEHWRPAFSVVEEGASVGSDVRLHDSVVLAGGVVESGSTLVRSVVASGGVVRRKRKVFEKVVAPRDPHVTSNGTKESD